MYNKYCVYVHKDSDGNVRYVGSGTIERANNTSVNSSRNKKYDDFIKTFGKLSVEIIKDSLTKVDALNYEIEQYFKYYNTGLLLNVNKPNHIKSINMEDVSKYVKYDETSDSCLRWKIDIISGNNKVQAKAESVAGRPKKETGVWYISINKIKYSVNRVIAKIHGLEIDGHVIDHIDGDVSNNKISNLRVVLQSQNNRNKGKQSNNTTGVTGVRLDKKYNSFVSQYRYEGKVFYKWFSIRKYGYEEAMRLAIEHRNNGILSLQELGIIYSDRHGK